MEAEDVVWTGKMNTTSSGINCPLCGSVALVAFSLGDFGIADCLSCDHRFSPNVAVPNHVETVYGDSYFFGGGDGYDNYLVEADLLRAHGRRYGELLASYAARGRVLDVGAAAGFLQAGLRDAGWATTGLEPNGRMAAYARDVMELDTRQGTLEDAPELPPFDAVCMIQVIGHFHDLPRALGSAAQLTRPGGLCLVEYWRRDTWMARTFGTRWHEYSPPSVLHWFTQDSLDRAFQRNGFSVVAAGKPKKYISGGHARSLLAHKLSGTLLGRQLATLIPAGAQFRYPAFDLAWRLFRREGEFVNHTTGAAP